MQLMLVIYNGNEESVSEEDKKAAYADYTALNSMENVTGCPPLGPPDGEPSIRYATAFSLARPYGDGHS